MKVDRVLQSSFTKQGQKRTFRRCVREGPNVFVSMAARTLSLGETKGEKSPGSERDTLRGTTLRTGHAGAYVSLRITKRRVCCWVAWKTTARAARWLIKKCGERKTKFVSDVCGWSVCWVAQLNEEIIYILVVLVKCVEVVSMPHQCADYSWIERQKYAHKKLIPEKPARATTIPRPP